jgi:hypothetical protein
MRWRERTLDAADTEVAASKPKPTSGNDIAELIGDLSALTDQGV